MGKVVLKKGIIALLYIIAAIGAEMCTFAFFGFGLLPKHFLYEFLIIFSIGAVVFILPSSIASICVAVLFLLAQGTMSMVNLTLFNLYGDIFSLDLVKYMSEAGEAMTPDYIKPNQLFPFIGIVLAALGGMIATMFLFRGKVNFRSRAMISFVAVLAFSGIFVPTVYTGGLSSMSASASPESGIIVPNDKVLYDELNFKQGFMYKFGTYPFYFRHAIFGHEIGDKVSVSDADALEYFGEPVIAAKNSYFGADEGNNLIVILLESTDKFFIDEKYTPTLYSLMSGGINFTNYYAKAKTDYSEAAAILGSYPHLKSDNIPPAFGSDPDKYKADGFFAASLPNVMKRNGAEVTSFFHANKGSYYSRNETHPLYGFDNTYFGDTRESFEKMLDDTGFDYRKRLTTPERWFIGEFLDEFMPSDKRFVTYLSTMNVHGGYGSENLSPYAKGFYDKIRDEDFGALASEKHYPEYKVGLAKAMVLDDGITFMLEELGKRGLKDKTTIAAFADHNAYSNNLTFDMKKTDVLSSPAFNVPAFIYSPTVGPVSIDKFMTTFDLVPTIFQLMGIEYNEKLYLGIDAFDERTNVINSKIGGVFNDKYYTTDVTEVLFTAETAKQADFERFQSDYLDMNERWHYIDYLYKKGFKNFV